LTTLYVTTTEACSSGGGGNCACEPDFQAANTTTLGTFCYKVFTASKNYATAKSTCEGINAEFPRVDSQDELDFFGGIRSGPQWIQAQKTGAVINFNRWRDWDGKSLRGLDWYKEEEAKEYEG